MYTIIKTIYQRIKREPTTSFFLIIGFALAMLMVSMGTSYVTELVRASDDKKNYAPPNGDQLVMDLCSDEKSKMDIEAIMKMFEKTKEETGIMVNDVMVNLDSAKVHQFFSVSAEWFKSDDVWHYLLAEGRYYTKEEILAKEKVVLIGKALQKYAKKENGETYIGIEGTDYKVLGIVGFKDKDSLWDSRVFMPVSSLPEKALEPIETGSFQYIIYNEEDVAEENIALLKDALKEKFENVVIENAGKIEMDNVATPIETNKFKYKI